MYSNFAAVHWVSMFMVFRTSNNELLDYKPNFDLKFASILDLIRVWLIEFAMNKSAYNLKHLQVWKYVLNCSPFSRPHQVKVQVPTALENYLAGLENSV